MGGLAPLAAAVDPAGTQEAAARAAASLDSLVALALARAPMLGAGAAEVAAMREEVSAAGALPDPMLAIGAVGEDYPGAGLGDDPMAMTTFEVTQAIPWPGKRALRTAAAEARVPGRAAALEAERRSLAADVRGTWAELYAVDASLLALRRSAALLDVLEPQALALYESGRGTQSDWLALRRERLRLEGEVDGASAEREAMLARLGAAVGDTSAAARARPSALPADPGQVALDGAGFASVAMAEAEERAAAAELALARRESRPDLVVGAEYGWRDAMAPMVTARIGLELPLWKGRKQEAMARAADARRAAADATVRAERLDADAEARSLAARRHASLRAAARLREQVLPLLELAAESARARFLAADGDAVMLITALKDLAEARAELAREDAEAYAAAARLLALSGRDPVAGDGRMHE